MDPRINRTTDRMRQIDPVRKIDDEAANLHEKEKHHNRIRSVKKHYWFVRRKWFHLICARFSGLVRGKA